MTQTLAASRGCRGSLYRDSPRAAAAAAAAQQPGPGPFIVTVIFTVQLKQAQDIQPVSLRLARRDSARSVTGTVTSTSSLSYPQLWQHATQCCPGLQRSDSDNAINFKFWLKHCAMNVVSD